MVIAIIQARVSSTRLPEKILLPILGEPMLYRQIERVKRCKMINSIIVATSDDKSDDPIEKLCSDNMIDFFRGSLNDVLDRYYQAAKIYKPDHIIRLTGDCPLIDPNTIDKVVCFHLEGGYDYTSNIIERTYPDGLDVEIFTFECLEQTWKEAELPSRREHVTPFIYQHPYRFKIGSITNEVNLSHLRWTVDEREDFELVSKIYKNLYTNNPEFTMKDVLDFLSMNPELININMQYGCNEGYQKSLIQDVLFKQYINKKG